MIHVRSHHETDYIWLQSGNCNEERLVLLNKSKQAAKEDASIISSIWTVRQSDLPQMVPNVWTLHRHSTEALYHNYSTNIWNMDVLHSPLSISL